MNRPSGGQVAFVDSLPHLPLPRFSTARSWRKRGGRQWAHTQALSAHEVGDRPCPSTKLPSSPHTISVHRSPCSALEVLWELKRQSGGDCGPTRPTRPTWASQTREHKPPAAHTCGAFRPHLSLTRAEHSAHSSVLREQQSDAHSHSPHPGPEPQLPPFAFTPL